MEITTGEIVIGLIGLVVVILAIILGFTWRTQRYMKVLSQDIEVLSQDIKVLSQGTSALSQDINVLSQGTSALSQDIKALSESISGLSERQKEIVGGIEKVAQIVERADQRQAEAAKAMQRVAKHFAE